MADPKNILERTYFSATESIALETTAEEIGISKSALLRLAFLRFLRERRTAQSCAEAGLIDSANGDDSGLR
jgi:hypothetical protein